VAVEVQGAWRSSVAEVSMAGRGWVRGVVDKECRAGRYCSRQSSDEGVRLFRS